LVGDGDARDRAETVALVSGTGCRTQAFETGAELLEAALIQAPALTILDSGLRGPSAYEVCRELRDRWGERLPIVFVSADRTEVNDEIAALLLGADDYFAKPLRSERFLARIRRLLARAEAPVARSSLTPRELEILELLVGGRRPTEIAQRLHITRKTASTHIEHIMAKLGAHSQAQAVAFALRDDVLGARLPRTA
jgi:DNA-binding NarL/FixJ family response regulator